MILTILILSICIPVYTYALYPLILSRLRQKKGVEGLKDKEKKQEITICIVGDEPREKIEQLERIDFPFKRILSKDCFSFNKNDFETDIVIFTDGKSVLSPDSCSEIIKPFSDPNVACVVGMTKNINGNGLIWKYENYTNRKESVIGCTTSGNKNLFAIRKEKIPFVDRRILNPPFYIITQLFKNRERIIFCEKAIAYVENDQKSFKQNLDLCMGYWQILPKTFCFIFPSKHSFVFISHRTLKWFVFINLICFYLCNILLIKCNVFYLLLFLLQNAIYIISFLSISFNLKNRIPFPLNVLIYFVEINLTYFLSFLKYLFGIIF